MLSESQNRFRNKNAKKTKDYKQLTCELALVPQKKRCCLALGKVCVGRSPRLRPWHRGRGVGERLKNSFNAVQGKEHASVRRGRKKSTPLREEKTAENENAPKGLSTGADRK